jgi:hypothetical protein
MLPMRATWALSHPHPPACAPPSLERPLLREHDSASSAARLRHGAMAYHRMGHPAGRDARGCRRDATSVHEASPDTPRPPRASWHACTHAREQRCRQRPTRARCLSDGACPTRAYAPGLMASLNPGFVSQWRSYGRPLITVPSLPTTLQAWPMHGNTLPGGAHLYRLCAQVGKTVSPGRAIPIYHALPCLWMWGSTCGFQ